MTIQTNTDIPWDHSESESEAEQELERLLDFETSDNIDQEDVDLGLDLPAPVKKPSQEMWKRDCC